MGHTTDHLEERLVSVVDHTVVPYPDIAQYEVNSRLVKSMALCELCITVVSREAAELCVIWHKTARLFRTHHVPPENVAEDLSKDQIHIHYAAYKYITNTVFFSMISYYYKHHI